MVGTRSSPAIGPDGYAARVDGGAGEATALLGGRRCTGLVELTDDPARLEGSGFWVVVLPYAGPPVLARFAHVEPAAPASTGRWPAIPLGNWSSSLDRAGFVAGVEQVRAAIGRGEVYQVNLTRMLTAPLDGPADPFALGALLAVGNPAPYAATVHLPDAGLSIVSASPECYLRRDGDRVWSSPIKGTAVDRDGFLAKDTAENVMIVDLVRNDLSRVCRPGTVAVPELCAVHEHPGLAHLVSTVTGRLRPDCGWPELITASFPPGSVTGAPKLAALDRIDALEPHDRGVYCGALGWVDADAGRGELNVAIRTFQIVADHLRLGTGGGITWGSDPQREWEETELKAHRLLAVAAGRRVDRPVTGRPR